MIKNLEASSGRSMPEWIALVRSAGLGKHGEMVNWLKAKHALGHGYANLVVHLAKAPATPAAVEGAGAEAWFAGEKGAIRPIFDAVMAAVAELGSDIELAPKQAYLSVRRSKQFACVHPSTKTRLDLGLQLKGVKPTGRLEAAGSWNGMVSHRVRLESLAQFDREVRQWLKAAYDAA
ncbi:MAG: DUF4287 domain-containing protein [Opitutaceae bacterium]|nr:DUF4287 domain-containing protein [Opitutaceae bacterium]